MLHPVFKFIPDFAFELFYFKTLLKKKIIFQPSGCREEMLKKDFLNFDQNVCSNCGFFESCDDTENRRHFSLIEKYSDLNVSFGFKRADEELEVTERFGLGLKYNFEI